MKSDVMDQVDNVDSRPTKPNVTISIILKKVYFILLFFSITLCSVGLLEAYIKDIEDTGYLYGIGALILFLLTIYIVFIKNNHQKITIKSFFKKIHLFALLFSLALFLLFLLEVFLEDVETFNHIYGILTILLFLLITYVVFSREKKNKKYSQPSVEVNNLIELNECPNCSSSDIIKVDGKYICEYCKSIRYISN